MKKNLIVYSAVSIILFLVAGCMTSNSANINTSHETSQYADPAKPIIVSPDKRFAIVIDSNPTTGYSWQLAKPINEKIIKFSGSEYIPANTKRGIVGAGGKEVWTFVAVAAGETAISLKYVRPWEKENPPASEATYKVIVR